MKQEMKKPVVYAFIDSQNLNMGVAHDVVYKGRRIYKGWKLDFEKFRRYLKDKHRVDEAYLFIGNLPGQESLYAYLQKCGYIVVLKPTTSYIDSDGATRVKGNVDTDVVLYAAAKEYENYNQAVIVTGDGDFLSLCEYLFENDKLRSIVIPNKLRFSALLNKYVRLFDFVSTNKVKLEKIEKNKKTSMDLPDAHDKVTRHGDDRSVTKKSEKVNHPGKRNGYNRKKL